MSATRSRVFALYRRVLRVGRQWDGNDKERNFIFTESRRRLEENRDLKHPDDIESAIKAGHDDIDIALHYKIPYPRPHNVDPGTVGGEKNLHRKSSRGRTDTNKKRRSNLSKQFRPK